MKVLATVTFLATLLVATNGDLLDDLWDILHPNPPTGPTCTKQCFDGTSGSGGLARRIVDGTNAVREDYKFMVSLHNETNYNLTRSLSKSFVCGASMITCKHVLTAGHCHKPCNSLDLLPFVGGLCVDSIEIPLVVNPGDYDLSTDADGPTSVIRVLEYFTKPGYSSGNVNYDLLILLLAEPVTFSNFIRPAFMPLSSDLNTDGKLVDAIGWGVNSTNGTTVSPVLQHVTLRAVSTQQCRKAYESFSKIIINDRIMCTEDPDPAKTKGTCFGDSGSPVLITCAEGYKVQVGIVSFLIESCANPTSPSGNTKVSQYIDFINKTTNGLACFKPCTIL